MAFYFTNDTEDTTPFNLWEAHKCVMRGTFIKLGTHRKKLLCAQIDTLLMDIHKLEQIHKASLAQVADQLSDVRDKRNSLLTEKAKAKLTSCR